MTPDEVFATDLEPLFSKSFAELRKLYSQYPCDKVHQLEEHDVLAVLRGHLIDSPMLARGEVNKAIGDDDMMRVGIYVLGASHIASFRYKAKAGVAYTGPKPRVEIEEARNTVTLKFAWPGVVSGAEVREWYEKYRKWLEDYLESLRVEVNEYNARLQDTAHRLIAERKAECGKRVDMVKEL